MRLNAQCSMLVQQLFLAFTVFCAYYNGKRQLKFEQIIVHVRFR